MGHKTAIVTGITGQDGSFLAELLLVKGYVVHGIVRRASTFNTARLQSIYSDRHDKDTRLFLHYGDVTDGSGLRGLFETVQPDEIYNLAAQSHVRVSFDQAEYTADTVALGTLRMLEALRAVGAKKGIRFYQAGSSEMFGGAPAPQSEATVFRPHSPYAVSKVAAHWYAVNYREAYGLFVSNGILFNHESERRGETFVTRKITRALTRIKLGIQKTLYLGNLEARRDWGYAGDYVEAMWRMLQADQPGDYVIATGQSYSVRDFLDTAAEQLNLDWRAHVRIDPRYFRPVEVDFLLGDSSKARQELGWQPRVHFQELVRIMVEHDLRLAEQERLLMDNGHMVATAEAWYA
ncbi:MAG TPA: GDP-mannose 4,6-dehydratase [Terriglobia bacterium]|nr:GDP-mannose 4,6-dehydratase [Terriglobia bacterium]